MHMKRCTVLPRNHCANQAEAGLHFHGALQTLKCPETAYLPALLQGPTTSPLPLALAYCA